jgi:hypothetical protein
MFGLFQSLWRFLQSLVGIDPQNKQTKENLHLNQMGYDDRQIEDWEIEEDILHEENDHF